jgi:hypothetical protein
MKCGKNVFVSADYLKMIWQLTSPGERPAQGYSLMKWLQHWLGNGSTSFIYNPVMQGLQNVCLKL